MSFMCQDHARCVFLLSTLNLGATGLVLYIEQMNFMGSEAVCLKFLTRNWQSDLEFKATIFV